MADYGSIAGPLSFQGGGGDYKSAYAAALSMNQQNYGNILAGYQQTMASQQNAQNKINTGYSNLSGQVLGSIAGIDQSQRQAIADQYSQNIGQQSQSLIDRGLGNSTVQSSVARGALYDKQKADIALTNSTQGLNAQYMSNLGLAGLNQQNQALQQNTGLAGQQLNWMNSVNAGYPDPRTYAMLAQMKGQSGIGGGMGGGGVSYGGAVKSPLQGGQMYAPNTYGSGGYAGSYGPARTSGGVGGVESPSSIYPSSMGQGESSGIGYGNSAADDAFWASPGGASMGGSFSSPYGTFQQPTDNQAGGVVSLGDPYADDSSQYDE